MDFRNFKGLWQNHMTFADKIEALSAGLRRPLQLMGNRCLQSQRSPSSWVLRLRPLRRSYHLGWCSFVSSSTIQFLGIQRMFWLWQLRGVALRLYHSWRLGWTCLWLLGSCCCTQNWLMFCPSRLCSIPSSSPLSPSLGHLDLFSILSAIFSIPQRLLISFLLLWVRGSSAHSQFWGSGVSVCSMSWLSFGEVWWFQFCFGVLPIRWWYF